ncbi:MAG: histidine kinase [Betaproteobacteria bacterium HGW-Betaproteobacteria-21]|nr:MAG: histidine kinase [Betaproteobacteria bacterium HGW-Betaproteobacteria-21]
MSVVNTPWSLRARLLVVSVTVLLGFVVLTGVALDRAFRDSADAAQGERLEALLYLLMGTMELDAEGRIRLPAPLPEPRLATPGSGLYAQIRRADGGDRWVSDSTLGHELPFGADLAPGMRRSAVAVGDGVSYRTQAQGVRWAIGDMPVALTLEIAAPLASTGAEVGAYRRSLWSALALMAALLLVALVAVQRWGLRPLRTLARRLAAMEAGEEVELSGPQPRELAPLVSSLDRLLRHERALLERHRAALADLAHSLKTPLAVLRGAPADAGLPEQVREQTRRMDEIVQYQLQRAVTAGASMHAPPIALAPVVDRMFASMTKVHADRRLALGHDIAPGLSARIDEGDAMELLGNLIDNACKWAAGRVEVHAWRGDGGLYLVVEDDGPGIAEPARLRLRGERGDERMPGHGIGLAVVHDIALAYRGELRIERAKAGGARMVVWLGQ